MMPSVYKCIPPLDVLPFFWLLQINYDQHISSFLTKKLPITLISMLKHECVSMSVAAGP